MKEGLVIGNLQEEWEESKRGTIRLDLAQNNSQQHTLFAWVTLSEDCASRCAHSMVFIICTASSMPSRTILKVHVLSFMLRASWSCPCPFGGSRLRCRCFRSWVRSLMMAGAVIHIHILLTTCLLDLLLMLFRHIENVIGPIKKIYEFLWLEGSLNTHISLVGSGNRLNWRLWDYALPSWSWSVPPL